jgi:molybdopterin-guanine dinucleotide biosynthesis protein A
MKNSIKIAGVILAGGKSSRFDYKDKSWAIWQGKPLIEQVIENAAAQVDKLCISSNQPESEKVKLERFNLPLVADDEFAQQGPMSGILCALQWAKKSGFEWLVSFPVDTPNIPNNLVEKFAQVVFEKNTQWVIASDENYKQNALCLWSVELIEPIREGLQRGDNKVLACLHNQSYEVAYFPISFLNINNAQILSEC